MQEEDQDARDVAAVVAGNTDAFEAIVRRWQHRLITLAWRFSRDRMLAEDMAQEAFLKAFRSLKSFRGDSAFSTWLTTIALNTYRSRIRTENRPLVPLQPEQTLSSLEGDAVSDLIQHQRDERIRLAVLKLPAKYRDALLLFYFQEQSLTDTAQLLGLSEGTLKARLHRGRELLKRKYLALDTGENDSEEGE